MSSAAPKRRWFRFSLRAMLVVVALLCAWLASEANRVRNMRRAVELVQGRGALAQYHHQRINGLDGLVDMNAEVAAPRWLRRILGDDYFRSLHSVIINQYSERIDNLRPRRVSVEPLSKEDVAILGTQSSLELLSLDMPLRDEDFHQLQGLTNLRGLFLWNTQLTDKSMKTITRFKELKQLAVMSSDSQDGIRSPITDRGVASLAALKNLTNLRLARSQITDAAMVHLQALTKLESLDLDGTDVGDAGIAQLQNLGLNAIYLRNTRVTGDGARLLMAMPTLESLAVPFMNEEAQAFNAKSRSKRQARLTAQRATWKPVPAATGS